MQDGRAGTREGNALTLSKYGGKPMEEEAKKIVLVVMEEHGHLRNFEQQLRLEYMRGVGSVTPKVIICIANSEEKPRSFRTDNPEKMRSIIRGMCKILYQLELDGIKKKRLGNQRNGCPECGAVIEELSIQDDKRFYCCKCGNVFSRNKFLNENGIAKFNH